MHASPAHPGWPKGRQDVAIFNVNSAHDWPEPGLMGHAVCELQLIMHPIPRRGSHITCFKIGVVDPVTKMHTLTCTKHVNGTLVGDIVPLTQIQAFISIIPKLGAAVDPSGGSACLITIQTDSSTGFLPEGGCTYDLVKDLLRSELKGYVIFEADLNIKNNASLFHQLVPESSLKTRHIEQIKYYGRTNGPLVYLQGMWNFDHKKRPKLTDQNNNSGSGNLDDESGTSTDIVDTDAEALDSECSGIISQNMDGTWSRDEYDGTAEPGSKRGYVLSFVKHMTSDFSKRHDLGVYWGSATKSYLIMQEQPWHHFILSFSICAEQLHAHYCDHSGLIITLLTPIQSSPSCVADAIAALLLGDLSLLDLNPTIHMCIPSCKGTHTNLAVGAISWVTNNSNNRYSIMAVLWKSQGLFCHGMACYRVRDPVDGEYMMKDCWVAEVKRYHEVDVLERVKGIPNVVQLVDHWDVQFNGEPDCTAHILDGYGALLGNRLDKRFCNRYYQHLLLTPCGDPLWDFSSRKELICTFRDFVVAHEAMIQQRVLHGNLSPNNFVISEGIGYFIDFDHVSIIKEGKTFTVSFGTGTVPYISMHILKKMSKNTDIVKKSKTTINAKKSNSNTNSIAQLELVEHNSGDNLESLFYILFKFVSKYGRAHGTLTPTWDKTTILWADAYENLGATSTLVTPF
ncbi:uncharacterized protein BJ212DRAFT_1304861 [Suillus subaureus]|uniref:Protein kinase domain-containing protein n=1 Tax=Suillus subaureus TaxID=48587 RepID=A0A9P7DSZ3_9AGAM|nr:uncharacterized protein BJ212DRAFT_1304861 [Suillus subaureus]KAG1802390.1 hypothetical protein BJ212DRAFT_1304861 [Suillus subaureus]